jgi:hypothetical protein
MLRRDFLKNSIGALLGVALTSNKALASIVETLTPESPKVLLYLIQTTSGLWKVKATKWVDLYKSKRLKPCKVKKETFQALDIVDYENATKRKYELWKQYNCIGKLTPVRIIEDTIAGKKSITSKNYIDYLNSDKFKEIMKIRLIAANKASKNMSEEQRKILSEIKTLPIDKLTMINERNLYLLPTNQPSKLTKNILDKFVLLSRPKNKLNMVNFKTFDKKKNSTYKRYKYLTNLTDLVKYINTTS